MMKTILLTLTLFACVSALAKAQVEAQIEDNDHVISIFFNPLLRPPDLENSAHKIAALELINNSSNIWDWRDFQKGLERRAVELMQARQMAQISASSSMSFSNLRRTIELVNRIRVRDQAAQKLQLQVNDWIKRSQALGDLLSIEDHDFLDDYNTLEMELEKDLRTLDRHLNSIGIEKVAIFRTRFTFYNLFRINLEGRSVQREVYLRQTRAFRFPCFGLFSVRRLAMPAAK